MEDQKVKLNQIDYIEKFLKPESKKEIAHKYKNSVQLIYMVLGEKANNEKIKYECLILAERDHQKLIEKKEQKLREQHEELENLKKYTYK